MQVNPSDVGIYDRVVVQELIKNVASMDQIDTGCQRKFKVNVFEMYLFLFEHANDFGSRYQRSNSNGAYGIFIFQ